MSFHFIRAGLQTSIQDNGRQGYMHLGIANSGAMDSNSMKRANWLVDKPFDSAVFEVTLIGPKIQFQKTMSIAICGAEFDIKLNGKNIFNNETIKVQKSDVLEFGKLQQGARAYIAFSGQLQLAKVLNSYSTHLTAKLGGYKNRALINNDIINISTSSPVSIKKSPQQNIIYSGNYLLRCVESVESKLFNETQKKQFYQQRYLVNLDSNRMGLRLDSNAIKFNKNINILSSGLTQGSIQIPPSGLPIISSVDGQTIGGYPRIANIINADLPLLGQLKARDKINFVLIDNKQAIELMYDK